MRSTHVQRPCWGAPLRTRQSHTGREEPHNEGMEAWSGHSLHPSITNETNTAGDTAPVAGACPLVPQLRHNCRQPPSSRRRVVLHRLTARARDPSDRGARARHDWPEEAHTAPGTWRGGRPLPLPPPLTSTVEKVVRPCLVPGKRGGTNTAQCSSRGTATGSNHGSPSQCRRWRVFHRSERARADNVEPPARYFAEPGLYRTEPGFMWGPQRPRSCGHTPRRRRADPSWPRERLARLHAGPKGVGGGPAALVLGACRPSGSVV